MNRKIMILGLISLPFLSFLGGCKLATAQGKTKILEVSQEDTLGGTGASSTDIRSMAERMALEIMSIQWPKGVTPRIALLPIENHTRFTINPKVIQERLLVDLVTNSRGKLVFLARDSEAEVMTERSKKRSGMYDASKEEKAMYGADYLLKGKITSLSKGSREGVSDYLLYTFTLIDAESQAILWMGSYETKKQGETGVLYQ